jgi:hypothetical protein
VVEPSEPVMMNPSPGVCHDTPPIVAVTLPPPEVPLPHAPSRTAAATAIAMPGRFFTMHHRALAAPVSQARPALSPNSHRPGALASLGSLGRAHG